MYLDYFGLRREPFSVTSDPAFLWMSPAHEEAFAHIRYAVVQKKGFALLSGEVGTGKTTLVNQLLNQLDDEYPTCVVYNPILNLDSLFQYMFRDFAIGQAPADRGEALSALYEWLAREGRAGRTPVVVIDEAQNLPDDSLEGLRLLSNFETEQTKLLQILLVGQPELRRRLQAEHLRQIQQRIAIQYHLVGLEPSAVAEYLRHRLHVAGAPRPDALFAASAIGKLGQASQGVPRVINQLADLCLLKAFSQGKPLVDAELVDSVLANEFAARMGVTPSSPYPAAAPIAARPATIPPAALPSRRGWGVWPLAGTAVVLAGISLAVGIGIGRREDAPGLDTADVVASGPDTPVKLETPPLAEDRPAAIPDVAPVREDSLRRRIEHPEARQRPAADPAVAGDGMADAARRPEPERAAPETPPVAGTKVRIRPNDTLVKIALRVYGRDDWGLVQRICAANPGINDPNVILVGDEIVLPAP